MPTITSIKPQKSKKRVNIHLDGKFAFGLDLENYLKLGLKVEQELTKTGIEEIVKKAEFQKTYDKILRFASLRPRSEKEYKDWFRKHKVHSSLHMKLFSKLKRLDFLNDTKFAVWWVDQRLQFKFKSKRELIAELRMKGINKNIVDDVLYDVKIDELKMAKKLIEKKKYKWDKLGGLEARKKMSTFLAGKGYGWDVVKEVIKVRED